jgi:hypothetical protein
MRPDLLDDGTTPPDSAHRPLNRALRPGALGGVRPVQDNCGFFAK